MKTLEIPQRKALRAAVIARHVAGAGYAGVVCFSCGNASRALKAAGLYVVEVAPGGDLAPGRWWGADEIRRAWPHLLDATSGHLGAPLMAQIAAALRAHLGRLEPGAYAVPTGSGETLVCLAMAYPACRFRPLYGDTPGTRYEAAAPLNPLVAALAAAGDPFPNP
ncbi:MAG TPA: hypothetical protein VGE72_25090 [Azospirillum sp.]